MSEIASSDKDFPERLLVDNIRAGDTNAWQQLIDRFEGRLLAFVGSRLVDRSHAEDIVQETFVGFVNSLPNFDCQRPLESYLFSIAAYKLTDHLRREGRRHTTAFHSSDGSSDGAQQVPAPFRAVSSFARSVERRDHEEIALVEALQEQIEKWKSKSDWLKLRCIELLFVAGSGNKETAEFLGITEQQVANYKSDFVLRTKTLISRIASRESFPELS
ncbi:MAG: sigma-70 family RNA polymerase sigma factor [Pirellula sp.]